MGTLVYASPEQVEGRTDEIGTGSDIYSLGVILYELIAGRLPFQGSRYVLMRLIVETEPDPPSKYSPGVGDELDAIVGKALAKHPKDRYLSMIQFSKALTGYLERSTEVPPRRWDLSPIPPPPVPPVLEAKPSWLSEGPERLRQCPGRRIRASLRVPDLGHP